MLLETDGGKSISFVISNNSDENLKPVPHAQQILIVSKTALKECIKVNSRSANHKFKSLTKL